MLSALIQAAREYCEGYAGQSLVTQTREVSVAVYVEGMWLPFGPVQSVTAPPETSAPYTVQYVAGYPPVEGSDPIDYVGNIPASYKLAMQLLIGDWYENRENTVVGTTTGPLQIAVHQLLSLVSPAAGLRMRAGTLNRRVRLESRVETDDEAGEPIPTWVVFAEVWGALEPTRGREFMTEAQIACGWCRRAFASARWPASRKKCAQWSTTCPTTSRTWRRQRRARGNATAFVNRA